MNVWRVKRFNSCFAYNMRLFVACIVFGALTGENVPKTLGKVNINFKFKSAAVTTFFDCFIHVTEQEAD